MGRPLHTITKSATTVAVMLFASSAGAADISSSPRPCDAQANAPRGASPPKVIDGDEVGARLVYWRSPDGFTAWRPLREVIAIGATPTEAVAATYGITPAELRVAIAVVKGRRVAVQSPAPRPLPLPSDYVPYCPPGSNT